METKNKQYKTLRILKKINDIRKLNRIRKEDLRNTIYLILPVIIFAAGMSLLERCKTSSRASIAQNRPILSDLRHVREELILESIWVTLYHPTRQECGNELNNVRFGGKGFKGGCAVSKEILYHYADVGDTICVLTGTFKGNYIINDLNGSKLMMVDVWRPVDDNISKGCKKERIKIFKRKKN